MTGGGGTGGDAVELDAGEEGRAGDGWGAQRETLVASSGDWKTRGVVDWRGLGRLGLGGEGRMGLSPCHSEWATIQ